jgi:hypothetical protein
VAVRWSEWLRSIVAAAKRNRTQDRREATADQSAAGKGASSVDLCSPVGGHCSLEASRVNAPPLGTPQVVSGKAGAVPDLSGCNPYPASSNLSRQATAEKHQVSVVHGLRSRDRPDSGSTIDSTPKTPWPRVPAAIAGAGVVVASVMRLYRARPSAQ